MLKTIGSFLTNPVTVIGSAGLGVLFGAQYPGLAKMVAPFGSLFMAMLQMVALPIIMCAVIYGLGSLLYSGLAGSKLKRFSLVLICAPLLAAAISMVVGTLAAPGKNLPPDAEAVFGDMITKSGGAAVPDEEQTGGLWTLAQQVIPENIFVSLVDGRSLQVLFFSILVGIALGLEKGPGNRATLEIVQAIFDSLLKIINWLMYLLPLGLFCLMASQVKNINLAAMQAMANFAIVFVSTCLIVFIICAILIAQRTKTNPLFAINALRESLLVAAGAANSFAALPSALRGLQRQLKLDRQITDLMTPLALNLMPLGTIVYFTIASLFIAQISGISLDGSEYFVLFFGSIMAGLAAAALPAAAGIGVIAIVLEPLGLPVGVAVVLLIAIDPLIEPANVATDIFVASTAACLVADPPAPSQIATDSVINRM